MSSERWRQVEGIYHAALSRPFPDRSAFLAAACAGDDDLRREVESLLAQTSALSEHILGEPVAAVESGSVTAAGDRSASLLGSRLGHFHIVDLLGATGTRLEFRSLRGGASLTVCDQPCRGMGPASVRYNVPFHWSVDGMQLLVNSFFLDSDARSVAVVLPYRSDVPIEKLWPAGLRSVEDLQTNRGAKMIDAANIFPAADRTRTDLAALVSEQPVPDPPATVIKRRSWRDSRNRQDESSLLPR
jgi:hypothetical protein